MNSEMSSQLEKENFHKQSLVDTGFLQVKCMHDMKTLDKWNKILDPLFESEPTQKRPYIYSDTLYDIGILNEIFNTKTIKIIENLIPNARVYHCHAYETEGNQTKSHIHGDNGLRGWHRDGECLFAYEQDSIHHLTLFINLTDISEQNGPFEFSWVAPGKPLKNGAASLKVTGKKGSTFLFDRNYYHRATPNQSNVRRRVVKISFQNEYLPNENINTGSIYSALERLTATNECEINDQLNIEWIKRFFGNSTHADQKYKIDSISDENSLPEIVSRISNSKVKLSYSGQLKNKWTKLKVKERRLLHLTPERSRARVLLIGSGNRIQNNFLPALKCVSESFEIKGIYSRTAKNSQAVADKWGVKAIENLKDVNFEEIDVVMLSISTSAVPRILKYLQPYGKKINLLIDTPVMDGLYNLPNLKLLRVFKNVQVAEDFMNFPQFTLIRNLIDKQSVGKVNNIILEHTGYRYHGVALAKSLLKFPRIKKYTRNKRRYGFNTHDIIFNNHARATIVQPYQRLDGKVIVEGEKGKIIYSPDVDLNKIEKNSINYYITHGKENENDETLMVWHKGVISNYGLEFFTTLKSMTESFDKTSFNLYKTEGLIKVINALKETNINSNYTYIDCFRDNIISVEKKGVVAMLGFMKKWCKSIQAVFSDGQLKKV